MTDYLIVRRAFSQYEVTGTFTGSWVDAMEHASKLQAEKRDGEYSIRSPGQPLRPEPSSSYQSGLDWL